MYRLAVILLVTVLTVQVSSAETNISDINDPDLRNLAENVATVLDNNYEWLNAFNEAALRNSEVAKSLDNLANNLTSYGLWLSYNCVFDVTKAFIDLKNRTLKVYQYCGKLLTLTADAIERLQTEINNAIEGIKKYDVQFQELESQCHEVSSFTYLECEKRVQSQIALLKQNAREELTDPIYGKVERGIEQNIDVLDSCIYANSASLVQEINKNIQNLDNCQN